MRLVDLHFRMLVQKPTDMRFGGGNTTSKNDINKTILLSAYTESEYETWARQTRFFIFPFWKGSTLRNPDIVSVAWEHTGTVTDGTTSHIVAVASTKEGLSSPSVKPNPKRLPIEKKGASVGNGFLKKFGDVKGKGMILYARAKPGAGSGLTILPQVYEQATGKEDVVSHSGELQMQMQQSPPAGENYQVLVGDTR